MKIISNVVADTCKYSENSCYAMSDIRIGDKVFPLRVPESYYTNDKEMLEIFNEISFRINKG